jgi:hypothetical protein
MISRLFGEKAQNHTARPTLLGVIEGAFGA